MTTDTWQQGDGWRSRTLAQVVTPEDGLITGPFGSQLHASDYVEEGIPVIMPQDLVAGRIEPSTGQVDDDKAAQMERYRLQPGDVVIARRGEIGRCALVTEAHAGWLCGTGCLRARFGGEVEPRYFVQLLRWSRTVAWLEARAVGQTMANLSRRTLQALPLTLPPRDLQLRLAEVLETVDHHGENLERLRLAEAALQRGLLVRLLKVPTSAVDWRIRPIGELASFTNGHRFHADEWSEVGLPIIRIQNLRGNSNFKRFAGFAKDAWVVEPGELLFAWAGTRSSLGPTLWPGPKGVLNQHIFRVRPHEGIDSRWLFEVLRQVTRDIEQRAHGFKSTLLHLRKRHITDQTVAVPPLEIQQHIAQQSELLSQRLLLLEEKQEGLNELKKGLMEDLFSGRRTWANEMSSRHPLADPEPQGGQLPWSDGRPVL